MVKPGTTQGRDKRYCIAYWCLNSDKKNPDVSFFSLPPDPARRREWLKLIGREDLAERDDLKCKSYVVCSDHFEKSQIKQIRHLTANALPKAVDVNTAPLPPPAQNSSKKEGLSLKRKLTDKPTTSENKNQKLCDRPETSTNVTKDPIYIYSKNSDDDVETLFHKLIEWKEKNHPDKLKMFTLNLLIYSPQAYQCLKTVLNLPSKKTFIRYKLNIPPCLDDKTLNRIQIKLKSLPDEAKYCIICLDKFPLQSKIYYDTKADEITGFHCINERRKTEIATQAYVVTIQGIYFKWQQPVTYVLLGYGEYYDELDTWLRNIIRKLFEIGIKIKAITSDDSSYFTKFAKDVKLVTTDSPFIKYNKTEYFYIFDVPHLMLSIRNHLLIDDLCYGTSTISWDYIKILFQKDSQKENKRRLLPKLTNSHIDPNEIEKNNVQFALETLSGTVSAALHTYIDLGHMPEEARPTALFIETLSNLFDVLNSGILTRDIDIQSGLQMTKYHNEVIKNAIEMFADIHFSSKQAETIKNFQISIKAIKMLYAHLKTNEKLTYLPTRRLSKDCLKAFYNALSSSPRYLTPIQFRRKFSNLFLRYVMKTYSPYASSGLDLHDVLAKFGDVNMFGIANEPSPMPIMSIITLGPETDYKMDLPKDNTLIYVSSFLLFKCVKKHKCLCINRFWDSCRSLSESNLFHPDLNTKLEFHGQLKIPTKEFIQYIQDLESTITQNSIRLIKKSPGTQLYKLLRTVHAKVPCPCFPLSYLLKLFVRLRIYETLKFNNNDNNSGDKKFLKIKQL